MLLCHLIARRLEKAKNRKINITMFSASALCLMHHWNIPVSVRVRDRTRPTCPGVKTKMKKKRNKVSLLLNPSCSSFCHFTKKTLLFL